MASPLMLNHYIAAIKRRLPPFGDSRRATLWANRTFNDFVLQDGDRKQMLSTIADHALRLTRLAHDLDADTGRKSQFARTLLNVCAWTDSGHVRLEGSKLRSYEDISIQVTTLRRLVDYLSGEVPFPGGFSILAALVVEQFPDSRPALLVRAELFMEQSHMDKAIELIQRALRIQAVCPSAQQLLGRAYAARREMTGSAGELDGMNYDLSDKFCHMPFTHLATGFKGDAFACCCPAWVPFPIGNVLKAESSEAVWNSEVAAEIRRSVLDGDFSYCSRTLCSYIAAQKLPKRADITDPALRGYIDQRKVVLDDVPRMVQLNHDPTCNLACPSCRTEIIAAKAEEQDTYAQAAERVILPLLKKVNGQSYISGGGEAFASKHFRSILAALNRADYPGLYLYLITNGLLITPQKWSEFPHLPEMIDILSVSIDAARPDTFERLRRPGKWATLMRNVEFMAEMRRSGKIRHFQINFVVQEANYREILEFAELGARLGVDEIWFQRLTNYGAYDEETFAQADVTSPRHSCHAELLGILRSPVLKQTGMNVEMLMPLLPEVVASDLRLPLLYGASRLTRDRPYRGNDASGR
jgi:wyosine [tRNA(Phe)-imidazoG37] synthetase (radical SAM superfamily)